MGMKPTTSTAVPLLKMLIVPSIQPSDQFTGSPEVKVTRRGDRFAVHLLRITRAQPLREGVLSRETTWMDATVHLC